MTKVVPSANDGAEQAVPKTLDPATVKWSDRPVPEDGGVTRVSVELIVEDGFKVDTHNGEFLQVTFAIVLEWTDPRILAAGIDTSDQSAVPKDIWRPAACFPTNYEWADPQRPVTFISLAPGRLMWWRLTKPTRVDISSAGGGEERFRSFPFDSARIDFLFCMSDEIKLETDVDIELDFDRRNVKSQGGELRQMEWVGQRRQGEFVCTAVTFGVFKHSSPNTGLVYRDCIWSLHIVRDPTYYIFKGAVPIYVIVGFALFQFAMDVDQELTERLNFLVALMLSSFAIQWTVTDRLPRVPFLTSLDRLIFASLLALFMMALGSVITNEVVCGGELLGCLDVDRRRIRAWDRGCLGATMGVFLLFHLDIYRRVRAFTAQKGSHRTWKAVFKSNFGRPTPSTRRCPRGRVGSMAWRLTKVHTGGKKAADA